jgi:hypothetical protein
MTAISCRFMRLEPDNVVSPISAVLCTDPARDSDFCIMNWQENKCTCAREVI